MFFLRGRIAERNHDFEQDDDPRCGNDAPEDRCHRRRVLLSQDGEPEDHCVVGDERAAYQQGGDRKYELRPVHECLAVSVTAPALLSRWRCIRPRPR